MKLYIELNAIVTFICSCTIGQVHLLVYHIPEMFAGFAYDQLTVKNLVGKNSQLGIFIVENYLHFRLSVKF